MDRCAEAAEPVYRLRGGEGGIVVEHPDEEHSFPEPQRKKAYAMMERVLKGG